MTLRDRYNAIYARLWGYRDDCDAQHHAVLRELEKEVDAKLRALLEGLKAENIDQCMQEPPERLRVLGAILAEAADEAVKVLSSPEEAKGLTPLERYGAVVLDAHREEIGDLDGGFLQDQAEACGLLHYVDANEPCEGYCRCAEYDPAFPQRCLRIKPEIKERMEIDLRSPQHQITKETP